jgi:hypothetical protein
MGRLGISIIVLLGFLSLAAQPEYDRNSLSLMVFDFQEKHAAKVNASFLKLNPSDKFYHNPLQTPILAPGIARTATYDAMQNVCDEDILRFLKERKVGQQILSTWFNRQPDGSFNVETLKARGMYNADDNALIMASSSKRGMAALMDEGLKLVNQSYVLILDFYELSSMADYYELYQIPGEKRVSNGFQANVKGYLYKLDFGPEEANRFFEQFYAQAGDPQLRSKSAAFEQADFPFSVQTKLLGTFQATQANPDQKYAPERQKSESELMDDLVRAALDKFVFDMENRIASFRVKAMVCGVRPISAKIGKKEGLRFDQRYFVLENRMRKNGTIYQKRVGVVKSWRVSENRFVTKGETDPSYFYQIAGRKVDDMGLYLEQRNDLGINLFLGNTFRGLPGPTARMEYYVSRFLGELIAPGRTSKALTSLKIYIEGAMGWDKYSPQPDWVDEPFTFTRVSIGLNKDYYPLRFMHWGIYGGYGMEFTSWKTDENTIETEFIEAGLRLGINLRYNWQLLGSLGYYYPLSSKVYDKDRMVINDKFDYTSVFTDRFGVGSSLGLRIMF